MGRRITALCTALVGLAVAACDSPMEPVTRAAPGSAPFTELALPPSFTVYDGGEVNTSIAVESPIQCTERATVTVTIQGVLPPPPLLDVVLIIDESSSVNATEWGQEKTGFNTLLEVLDQADGADNNMLARAKIGIVKDGLGENFAGAPSTQSFSDDYATIQNFINTRHRTGNSDYAGSFTRARDMFTTGGRPGSVRFVVFVTDGNGGPENPATDVANLLKADGVRIMGIVVPGGSPNDITFAATLATPDAPGAQSFWGSTFPNLASMDPLVNPFYSIGNQIGNTPAPAAAATNLTFSANVPAGFTLVSASAVASKGTANLAGNTVTWTIGSLMTETVTLTFELEHDGGAEPDGGMLTALTNARLTGTDASGDPINESFADKQVDVQGCDVTPTPEEALAQLIAMVDAINQKIEKRLDHRLDKVLKELGKERLDKTCEQLDKFMNDVEKAAKKEKKLSAAQAQALTDQAMLVKELLGCSG